MIWLDRMQIACFLHSWFTILLLDVLLEKLPNDNSPKNTKLIENYFHSSNYACLTTMCTKFFGSVRRKLRVTHTRTHTQKCAPNVLWHYKTLFHLKRCEKISTLCVFSRIWIFILYLLLDYSITKKQLDGPFRQKIDCITLSTFWLSANSRNITWKKSSVETPNHSGESKNWCWNTMCRALWFCDTTSLFVGKKSQTNETARKERRCEMLDSVKMPNKYAAAFAKPNN